MQKSWMFNLSLSKHPLAIQKNMTKADIAGICLQACREFGEEYDFKPLDRVEGGIDCVNWPDRKPNQHKSVRFPLNLNHCWPQPTPTNWHQTWLDSASPTNDVVFRVSLVHHNVISFKAFGNQELGVPTPAWTPHEIQTITRLFRDAGFLPKV